MDVLDRYLHAVKFWLPRAQKQDIITELSEDIRSQIGDKEAELGRTLTSDEVEAILVRLGRPVLVAGRYLPQDHLIGPVWFPIYVFVLKVVTACYLVPWILVWAGVMIFSPAYRGAHSGGGWIGMVGAFWHGFWPVAMVSIGTVTVVFAVLERANRKSRFLEKWDPHKLPAVQDPNRIPRGGTLVELVVTTVFCSWWLASVSPAGVLDLGDVRITLAPAWPYFYWGFLGIWMASLAQSAMNLGRPRWTPSRAMVRLVVDVLGSAQFCWFTTANILAGFAADNLTPAGALDLTITLNRWIARALPIALGIAIAVLVGDIRRILRARRTEPRVTGGVPGSGMKNSTVL